jgi:hypothetical protein
MTKRTRTSEYRWSRPLWIALIVLANLNIPQYALADVNISPQDTKAILQTRELALQAINTGDFSKIKPYLHPTFTITTVDNRVFHRADEFGKYWNQQLSGPIKNIAMELKGDTLRTFLSPETEVAYGEAIATFSFTDGNVATMPMRWTAVLQKFQGKWTIQSLHFSANLLDNPLLNSTQQLGRNLAIGAGVGGLLLGAIIMFILRRQPKQTTKSP